MSVSRNFRAHMINKLRHIFILPRFYHRLSHKPTLNVLHLIRGLSSLTGSRRISIKLTLHDGIEGPGSIKADKRWSSDQLRVSLAALIGRGTHSFKIRKENHTQELRTGRETLRSLTFFNNISLHVSAGRPLAVDEEALTIVPLDLGFQVGLGPPPQAVIAALSCGRTMKHTALVCAEGEGNRDGPGVRGNCIDGRSGGDDSTVGVDNYYAEGGGGSSQHMNTPSAVVKDGADDKERQKRPSDSSARNASGGSLLKQALAIPLGEDDTSAAAAAAAASADVAAMPLPPQSTSTARALSTQTASAPCKADAVEESAAKRSDREDMGTGESGSLIESTLTRFGVTGNDQTMDEERSAAVARSAAPPASSKSLADGVTSLAERQSVFAEAAAAAAAAADVANRESNVLTRTPIEVVPSDECWHEAFVMAVRSDSTVAEIRFAVWQEMRRRGLLASGNGDSSPSSTVMSSSSLCESTGKGNANAPETSRHAGQEKEQSHLSPDFPLKGGSSPAALRLREQLGQRPAQIVRDTDGKLARLRSRQTASTRVLIAQALLEDEHLGNHRSSSPSTDHGESTDDCGVFESKTRAGDSDGADDACVAAACSKKGAELDKRGDALALLPPTDALALPPPTDALVLVVQWWNRWMWRLTEKYEVWISPTETVAAARNRLAQQVSLCLTCKKSGRLGRAGCETRVGDRVIVRFFFSDCDCTHPKSKPFSKCRSTK